MKRLMLALTTLWALAACAVPTDPDDSPVRDLGDFKLGHNIVVAPDIQKGPLSREMPKEQWIASMKDEIDARFGRYDGDRVVHFGVNINGYVLAQPGVPILFSPKSALIFNITAWDDRAGGKFNDEPRQIIVLESLSGGTLVGTGYTLSPEEQMENLTHNAAREIEKWLAENAKCLVENVPEDVLADCWKDTQEEQEERQRQLDALR
ncbi:hypothetical protein CLV88_1342 [Shimia abyssi]|uniref:DUF4136 domain-containing protein n=2 Tax=Shimia abyssi TaxID=1662395 RepID=A0A2P8EUY3_9RHOB|nr:hypothetical protein CLV88_1342 [Shimia abyssi]